MPIWKIKSKLLLHKLSSINTVQSIVIQTNGTLDIEPFFLPKVTIAMDYKTESSVALLNSANLNAIKQSLEWDIIIHNMIDDRLRGYEFYKKDANKFYNTLDCNSARFCFQKSLESLIDAYMFSKNSLIVKEKWRIKWLQKNNSQLYDELISLYRAIWSTEALSSVISRFESCYKKYFS